MKTAFALPLALVLALLVVIPVSAAPPVIETGAGDDNYPLFDSSAPCPGIEIWNHEVYTFQFTSYFDNQGNLLSKKLHALGTANLYNPLNPDFVLSGKFTGTAYVDLATGEFINASGVPAHITYPGYGTVLVRAGKMLQYPYGEVTGKDSLVNPKDMAQFCSLLAGN